MRNLVLTINEKNNYGRHLATTLVSVLENSKDRWNIYIIYELLSEKTKQHLQELVEKYNSKINYIKIDEEKLKKFRVGEGTHLTSIVFARLFIPYLLEDKSKAIYLDCDIVVLKPLELLYDMDLEEKSIGVILDSKSDQDRSLKRLRLSLGRSYFNSGVMLMDLKKIRENEKFLRAIEFCINSDRELLLNEQDALNIIFEDDYAINSIIWNYTHGNSEENSYSEDEIGIIHFTGEIKPWDCRNYSPYKKIYWNYLNKTQWKGTKEENRTLKNILRRELIRIKLWSRKFRYSLKNMFKSD